MCGQNTADSPGATGLGEPETRSIARMTWSLTAVVFFLLTLWALSVALRTIDVSVGYAVWAGIGSVGAALLGPAFSDEALDLAQALWLGVVIVGVVWLKLADQRGRPPREAARATQPQGLPGRPS